MQQRAWIMLIVAVLLGGLSVVLVNSFITGKGDKSRLQSLRTTPVVVANADIRLGAKLEPTMLRVVDWPTDSLPSGSFDNANLLVGPNAPVALREMRKDEIILGYKLSSYGARGGLPSLIPEDKRAVALPVDEISGVAGFIAPGNYVDILHTSTAGRSDDIPVTRVLLQNVQVVGIDQESAEGDSNKPKVVRAVTVLIDPESGQKIVLGQATGKLSLLLRNEFDASLLATQEVDWRDLGAATDQEPAAPVVVKRERRKPKGVVLTATAVESLPVNSKAAQQVEMVKGLKVTQQTVADPAEGNASPAPAAP